MTLRSDAIHSTPDRETDWATSLRNCREETRPEALKIAYVMQNAGNELTASVGPAVLIKSKVRGLARRGHHVHIFRLQGQRVVCIENLETLQKAALPYMGWSGRSPFRTGESVVRRLQRELRLPYLALFDGFRFYEACKEILPDYDICHEYGGLFSIGAAMACRKLGIPYVLTFEADPFLENEVKGTPVTGLRRWVAESEARQVLRLADRIVTVSEPAREHFIRQWKINGAKIVVIPNGVDLETFHPHHDPNPIRAEYGLGSSPVVGFVGGFQRWHGIEELIRIFTKVVEHRSEAKLLLVGDGPVRNPVMEVCRELGLEAQVVFTGLVAQEKVPEILAAIDVAVVPYPRLPRKLWFSPLKLYEYLAAGKAIVASRDGQIAEVVKHGITGILVEPGDIGGFASAIVRLLERPIERRRLGSGARAVAERHHSWNHYTDRLEQVYRSVIDEHK